MAWNRLWIVAYDVADPRRLRRVAKTLEAVGERQQKSVFDVPLSADARHRLTRRLAEIIDIKEDSVFLHPCCATCRAGIRWQGMPPDPGHEPFWIV
jgi:CRISPR-associated protein Cas2